MQGLINRVFAKPSEIGNLGSARLVELHLMHRILLLLALLCLPLCTGTFGQETQPDVQPFPDADITEQQWRARVEDARRRSEDYIESTRTRMPTPTQAAEDDAKAADDRAMSDPSLMRGDIVRTSKGFFVFVGTDKGERQPSDFIPLPQAAAPALHPQIHGR